MWAVTGWAAATWLRVTLTLAVLVGLCWWQLGTTSGWFWIACAVAVLVELWAIRALAAEWACEARSSWWWHR